MPRKWTIGRWSHNGFAYLSAEGPMVEPGERVSVVEAVSDPECETNEQWRESIERLSVSELAPVLLDREADALLSVLEKAINAGITPGVGLRAEDCEAAGFKIVAERFRDSDPYNRGARTIAVRLRSPNPDHK